MPAEGIQALDQASFDDDEARRGDFASSENCVSSALS